jgi:hypothetical protein
MKHLKTLRADKVEAGENDQIWAVGGGGSHPTAGC